MMQGFYMLALAQMRRRKRIAVVMCALTLVCSFFAARSYFLPPSSEETVAVSANTSYFAYSDENGNLVIAKGSEGILQTGINTRTLPEADQSALAEGIILNDASALAKLLEDYGS